MLRTYFWLRKFLWRRKRLSWIDHFFAFKSALTTLGLGVELSQRGDLSEYDRRELIREFRLAFELVMKTFKALLREKRRPHRYGNPPAVLNQAMKDQYIDPQSGLLWSICFQSYELTSKPFTTENSKKVTHLIIRSFYGIFQESCAMILRRERLIRNAS